MSVILRISIVTIALLQSACADRAPQKWPGAAVSNPQFAVPQLAAGMSLWEAKDIIQRGARWQWSDGSADSFQSSLEFTPERMWIHVYQQPDTTLQHRGNTPNTKDSEARCQFEQFNPYVMAGDTFMKHGTHRGTRYYAVWTAPKIACVVISVPTLEQAEQVAAALLRWKTATLESRQAALTEEQMHFDAVAEKYRAALPKPAIPEELRRFTVMADTAVSDKRFSDAVNSYLDGLRVAPWWPEGQFNAALVLGEIHYYDEAIEHMRKYLVLVPDAPDARAAQDKIYAWQGEKAAL
jgi:tetratricopeptide (TPR) repeat protein